MSPEPRRPSADRTRRRLLATGGAAFAASLSALTAGCLSSLPPLGEGQRYGRIEAPPADDPAYRRWLPAPSSVDHPVERYHLSALRPAASRAGAPGKLAGARARHRADVDYFGIGFENHDLFVDSAFGTVVEAAFDRGIVVATVADSGYERAGEYSGYTLLERSDVRRRVAVGDDAVVWTSAYHHEHPDLEALVDAGGGKRRRYHERNAAFEQLTRAAGGNPYLGVNDAVHDPTGRPAMLADAVRFGGDAAYQEVRYRYLTDSVPTARALEAALEEDDHRFVDGADAFDVRIDGPLATVTTRVPLRPDRGTDPAPDLPQVTWGVDHDADAGRVTFRHEAGEPVPAGMLGYDVVRPSAPGRIRERPFPPGVDPVAAGAEATVDLSEYPDATGVNVVYAGGGRRYHVPFCFELAGGNDG
ncbi:hypothetical protein [Halorarum salinum]|uniref:Uncharacterized protein n=1 Tax=Halorarum salinum TaxID=2743089 RepID=A0A7D5QA55_9EURY|nr:hypothetical protein [Halobaculum salinum]QLG60660.1 hypothetical protein HUG12_02425 [Halobaculum salinum]